VDRLKDEPHLPRSQGWTDQATAAQQDGVVEALLGRLRSNGGRGTSRHPSGVKELQHDAHAVGPPAIGADLSAEGKRDEPRAGGLAGAAVDCLREVGHAHHLRQPCVGCLRDEQSGPIAAHSRSARHLR